MAEATLLDTAERGAEAPVEGGTDPAGDMTPRTETPRWVVAELCELAVGEDAGTDPWPLDGDGEPEEYLRAMIPGTIGRELIDRIPWLEQLGAFRIHYLYRNAKSWEKNGKTVFGEMKKPTGLLKKYSGADFVVLLNWEVWSRLNPMQRVALVYHELRHGAREEGKPRIRPHDFEGFFDELQLFGTRTYEDWNALAQAVSEGGKAIHQYSLSLFESDADQSTVTFTGPDGERITTTLRNAVTAANLLRLRTLHRHGRIPRDLEARLRERGFWHLVEGDEG